MPVGSRFINKMKQFGHPKYKGLPKPSGFKELHKLLEEKKQYLYGVSGRTIHSHALTEVEICIKWAKKGNGSSGARHFKYNIIPALRFWNPDIKFVEQKFLGPIKPSLSITTADGKVTEYFVHGKTDEQIFEHIKMHYGLLPKKYLDIVAKASQNSAQV